MALLWTSTSADVQYLERKWRRARLILDETRGQLSVLPPSCCLTLFSNIVVASPCDVVCGDMSFYIWCSNTAIHYRWEVLKYILLGKFLSTQREPVINISWELNICLPADQHFQYLLQFYSILVLFHISSMIVGREEVLFAGPTLKWGSICCEANLKLLKYSLPLESYLGSSFSLSAMWANYCSFEKLYCIKIWQPIQTNVIYKLLHFVQWLRNGYTEVGTCKPLMDYKWQRWRSRKRADLQGWQTRFLYHSSVFQNFRHIFDFAFI